MAATAAAVVVACGSATAQKVDYSVVQVPEETGVEFIKVTKPSDYVAMPTVKRRSHNADWTVNRILGI